LLDEAQIEKAHQLKDPEQRLKLIESLMLSGENDEELGITDLTESKKNSTKAQIT